MRGTDTKNSEQDFSSILISKRNTQEYLLQHGLKKNLKFSHLWGITVGAVISGQFIGWNNSLNYINPFGLMYLTVAVSFFYLLFVPTITKLSVLLPYAGGTYAYARKAFGKLPGFLAGYITIVEYLCITAVILVYMKRYVGEMLSIPWPNLMSLVLFLVLIVLQLLGINKYSFVELLVTCLCVSIFLLFFMGINSVDSYTLPSDIRFENTTAGIFLAIPYVLWFFVGIDVVILTAEEIKTPDKTLPVSFYSGLATIITISFGVIFFSVSSVYWPSLRDTDYPLIFILQKLQQGDAVLLAVFSFLSISSFIASINGMMIGYSRQAFSLSRAGYFPKFMDKILNQTKTPFMALIAPSALVVVIAQVGNVTALIQIVCICAVTSYAFSLTAHVKITRATGGGFYKILPAIIALAICLVFIGGFFIYQTESVLLTLGIFLIGIIYYFVFARGRINRDAPEEVEANIDDMNIITSKLEW